MTSLPPLSTLPAPPPRISTAGGQDPLRQAANGFEAAFLAEMLTHAGLGQTPDGFGGGAGEDAFSSLMVREQARAIVAAGGIGLADQLYRAMAARS